MAECERNCLPLNLKVMSVSYERKGMICVRTLCKLTTIFTVVHIVPILLVCYFYLLFPYFYLVGLRVIHSFLLFHLFFSSIFSSSLVLIKFHFNLLFNFISPLMFHNQFFQALSDFLPMVQLCLYFLKCLNLLLNIHP